jgi:hypothetical protein
VITLAATLDTGFGAWNPLIWLAVFAIAVGLSVLIRSPGSRRYKKRTAQTKPFISGNPEPSDSDSHIRAGNMYWGYIEALRAYYKRLVPLHTGDASEYVLWMLGVLAAVMLVVMAL